MTTTSTDIAEYSPIEVGLADLRARFSGVVFDLTTTAGDKEARAGRGELMKLRTNLEATRTKIKAPVLDLGKRIDSEAKRITGELVALEAPIDDQIKKDERRRAAETAAKAQAEAKRKAAIADKIAAIRGLAMKCIGKTAESIRAALAELDATKIGTEYDEFVDEAMAARTTAINGITLLLNQQQESEALRAALDAAKAREADAATIRLTEEQEAAANAAFDAPAPETPVHAVAAATVIRHYPPARATPPAAIYREPTRADPEETVVMAHRPTVQAVERDIRTVLVPIELACRILACLEYATATYTDVAEELVTLMKSAVVL